MISLYIFLAFVAVGFCVGDIRYKWYRKSRTVCFGSAVLFLVTGIVAFLVQSMFFPALQLLTIMFGFSCFLNMVAMFVAAFVFHPNQSS